MLDLYQGNSIVQTLLDEGFDVFLLDRGIADAAEGDHTLDTYIDDYMPRAIAAARRASGAEDVTLVPYCLGASLALLLLGSRDDIPMRNLVDLRRDDGSAFAERAGLVISMRSEKVSAKGSGPQRAMILR